MFEQRRTHQAYMVVRSVVVGLLAGIFLLSAATQVFLYQPAIVLAEADVDKYETVSGTLGKLDLTAKTGTITTDLGKQIVFTIVKPELFINLSQGQRVTLKLDQQNRAIRVMDSAAPELPPPASPR